KRRPQVLALNTTWIANDRSVVTLRYGRTTFHDDSTMTADFDPATLGFNSAFINIAQIRKFPAGTIEGYDLPFGSTFGAIGPANSRWYSEGGNASYSRLSGTHTYKVGGDFQKIGLDAFVYGQSSGSFQF